jgi:hypothetical protein
MKIMQRPFLKFLPLFILLTIASFQPSAAQTSHYRLQTADSLFRIKRYTQSLEHYEEILRQKQYTPAMLLKMAYVCEGLNHIGSAMYYINLYYIATNDKSVLAKMDELATKYDLEGYETTDSDRFWAFYQDYHLSISLAIAALIILMVSFMYHTRVRHHTRPTGLAITVVALLALLFSHQQYGSSRTRGILFASATYVMAGPSAGAAVIDIVGDGHRVEVIGHTDVWTKIKWDDEIAYVKETSLRPVRL